MLQRTIQVDIKNVFSGKLWGNCFVGSWEPSHYTYAPIASFLGGFEGIICASLCFWLLCDKLDASLKSGVLS